jgi:D-methionine transport system substrate-binding protein
VSDKKTEHTELRASLAQSAKRRRTTVAVLSSGLAVVLAAGVVGIIAVRTNSDAQAEAADGGLSLTLATDEDSATNDTIAEVAAENGLEIDWVNLDDWVLPNTEVVAGSMDGNAFQHIMYLSNFDVENDADLVPVFSTFVSNWGVFSASVDALKDLPDGARIAIPDDASNGGRALLILQSAGLIGLADDAGALATTSDITDNPKDLEFVEISTQSIPQQFDDP